MPDPDIHAEIAALKARVAELERVILTIREANHIPDDAKRKRVQNCAGIGMTHGEIADFMGMTLVELEHFYEDELRKGPVDSKWRVANNLLRIATGADTRAAGAAQWWLERLGGEAFKTPEQRIKWEGHMKHEHSAAPPMFDSALLSQEQRDQLRVILQTAAGNPALPAIDAQYQEVPSGGLAGGEPIEDGVI